MKFSNRELTTMVLSLFLSFCFGAVVAAEEASSSAMAAKLPILIEQGLLDGKGLTVIDPTTAESDEGITTESPINFSTHQIFQNKISAYIFETDPGKVRIDGLPYDEYVLVLEGRLILTPDGHDPIEFKTGESLIVPEGYTGYWEMPEKYREFVIINSIPSPSDTATAETK